MRRALRDSCILGYGPVSSQDEEAIEPTYSKWGRLPRARRAWGPRGCGGCGRVECGMFVVVSRRSPRMGAARTPPPDREG